jgi:SNF2 family DNA or RNA helicase
VSEDALHPYQLEGADYLAGKRFALLADAMGLGKTAQAIRAADILAAKRILVLCPAIARVNWLREFDRFSLFAPPARALFGRNDPPGAEHVTVCSYDLASEHRKALAAIAWDVIICDEAHYLKSASASRTKTVLGRYGLVHRAKRLWLLTGTPMPNHPGDLWVWLRTAGLTPLNEREFIERYCDGRVTPFGFKVTGAKQSKIPELRGLLSKFMIRRTKQQVSIQLPPISYHGAVVEAGPVDLEVKMYDLWRRAGGDEKLAAVIDRQEATFQGMIETLKNSRTPMRDMLPLMEAAEKSMPELRQFTGLAKCPAIIEQVGGELERGEVDKIVLFAVHKSVIETLRDGLKKFKPVTLYGGTPAAKRQDHMDRFQKDPRCRVFIANIQAAGTAVTLTAAHEIALAEYDWTNANNAQAIMRVHRIGQEKPVRARFFSLANSTDERVAEVLRRKIKDELSIFGS